MYHYGVEPRVGGNLELVVLGEGAILVPLALQSVQVGVDHPGNDQQHKTKRNKTPTPKKHKRDMVEKSQRDIKLVQ